MVPLLPLRHKGAATILSNKLLPTILSNKLLPTHLDLLRLPLQLIVCTEYVHIRLRTIRLASPAELAQSEKTVRGQMMDLKLKFL
jgi:hypothetical protein